MNKPTRARMFILQGMVKLKEDTTRSLRFKVGTKYKPLYRKEKDLWTCQCEWNTLKGESEEGECSHILACKIWIRENKYGKGKN